MVWCFKLLQFCIEHLKLFSMKTILQILTLLLVSNFAIAQATQVWTADLPPITAAYNHTIASDSQGNVYSVGTYDGVLRDFDSGPGVFNMSAPYSNMYIVKVSASGTFVWAKQISGSYSTSTATAITIDASDNIYISGNTKKFFAIGGYDFDPGVGVVNVTNPINQYVMYILKLDSNGNHIWNKQFINPNNVSNDTDKIYALKVDNSGNIYATGSYNGVMDFDPTTTVYNVTSATTDPGNTEIFILKLNNSGNLVWVKAMQNANTSVLLGRRDRGTAIDIDSSGNVYTTGYYNYTVDADPSAAIHNLTAIAIFGTVVDANTQYISKLNTDGDYVWAYDLVGGHYDSALPSLAVDASNNVVITGDSSKYTGILRDFDFGTGVTTLPNDSGSWVLKINADAGLLWVKCTARLPFNNNTILPDIFGSGLVLDASGNIYTCGNFGYPFNQIDFDPSATDYLLTSTGMFDGYISKIDTNGNFISANKIGGSGNDSSYSMTVSASGKITISGNSTIGFAKSASAVSAGGYLASYSQPSLGGNEFTLNKKIALYPNPTTNAINLNFQNQINNGNLKIVSVTGQTVFEKQNLSGNEFNFDVSNLSVGVYILEVSDENSTYKSKFIKQ